MIPHKPALVQTFDVTDCQGSEQGQNTRGIWQQQLAGMIRDPAELLETLGLPTSLLHAATQGAEQFEVRVPWAFVSRMERGNPSDPLLRQVLPLVDELATAPSGFVLDPLMEQSANSLPGVIHKYRSRVLLITNGSCAIHCRYCFRRHFPYDDNQLGLSDWQASLDSIAKDTHVNEIILSGGDPLSSSDARLFKLLDMIEAIPQITRIRFHTRLPIVIPDRVTPQLVERLSASRLKIIMVIHANHANEIDNHVKRAMDALHSAGLHLLNQSVLLKGVNDHADALADLSESLFDMNVMPYYLHLLDPVIGTHHFDVAESIGQQLIEELLARLPGFLVPKLVREEAGKRSKSPIAPFVATN